MSLDKLNKINNKTKYTVYGFISESQLLLSFKENTFYIIPELVTYICLSYYYIGDKWDPKAMSRKIELNDETNTVKQKDHGSACVYLTNIVESGTHHWKFKIIRYNPGNVGWYTTIGVHIVPQNEKDKLECESYISSGGNCAYGFCTSTNRVINFDTGMVDNSKYYGKLVQTGDIVDMHLDLNKYILRYAANDKDYGIAYDDILPCIYRACTDFCTIGDSVSLLEYHQSN